MLSILYKRKTKQLAGNLFLIAVMFYFSYHLISGDKGVQSMVKIEQRLKVAFADLDRVELKKIKLGHKVKMLSSESLDIDLLDEQSRRLLGASKSNEIVILQDNN